MTQRILNNIIFTKYCSLHNVSIGQSTKLLENNQIYTQTGLNSTSNKVTLIVNDMRRLSLAYYMLYTTKRVMRAKNSFIQRSIGT
jgi:hypothetical protein